MLTKKIGVRAAMGLALCGALVAAGCTEPADGEGTLVTNAPTSELGVTDIGITATMSFSSTCSGGWAWHEGGPSGPITSAGADSCRRRNGTYSSFPSWTGRCTTDIANSNGVLLCTRTCP